MFKRRVCPDPHANGNMTGGAKGCPDIWELKDGTFAVIGKRVTADLQSMLPPTASCGPDEEIVVLPRGLLVSAKKRIFQMIDLITTSAIIADAEYFSNVSEFFQAFDDPWDKVQAQILKLETRQTYREPGNESYEAMQNGDFELALRLLPEVRKEDDELYEALRKRKVDFIRCRPIIRPIAEYLRWEIECYKLNEQYGERIYFTDHSELFDKYALHDFMVFDRFGAMVHDYDENGEIKGGWAIRDTAQIDGLIMLFAVIKASSVDYSQFTL